MTDETIRELLDKQAITEIIYRYARSMDRMDAELGYSVFHKDAEVDYGEFYRGPARGLIDLTCEQHRHALCHSHQMCNITIEVNGDRAASETYHTTNVRVRRDDQISQMVVWGRYIDRWSKRDGSWAIDRRIAIRDFDEIRAVTPLSLPEGEGRRDRRDVSYEALSSS